MDPRARSPLRFLAPVALLVAAIVFLSVTFGSFGGDEPESASDEGTTAQPTDDGGGGGGGGRNSDEQDEGSSEDTYEIQSGDTIDSIAEETGVPAEEIIELNPEVDPQALVAGQELVLGE